MSNISKILVALVAMLFSQTILSAQTAEGWLTQLNQSLGERYAMSAVVQIGDKDNVAEELNGLFMVDGNGYYLSLGVMEVYSDGKLRYEVNNERKEATIDRVDLESHDLLTNPTNAFRFAADEFYISLDGVCDNEATINLVPREDIGITGIELRLKRDGGRVAPISVTYNYDGDIVNILLKMRDGGDAKLPRWNKDAYRAYDVVSFI